MKARAQGETTLMAVRAALGRMGCGLKERCQFPARKKHPRALPCDSAPDMSVTHNAQENTCMDYRDLARRDNRPAPPVA